MTDETLIHYGVKGMRWGVRRKDRGGVDTANQAKPEKKLSSDAKEVEKLRQKPISQMSNAELRRLNDRLNLETNYNRLTTQRSTVETGRSRVEQSLRVVRTVNDIYNMANSPMVKKVAQLIRQRKN